MSLLIFLNTKLCFYLLHCLVHKWACKENLFLLLNCGYYIISLPTLFNGDTEFTETRSEISDVCRLKVRL